MDTQQKKGLWRFEDMIPHIDQEFRISLGEGNTPCIEKEGIYFKCEYINPTGSVKDRSIAFQVSKMREAGVKEAVISSSGNAAISATVYCQKANIHITVFLSLRINKQKLDALKRLQCNYRQSFKPISEASHYAKEFGAYNLRQSNDPNALPGYETIAYEIGQLHNDIDAVFIPVSSGTTFAGMHHGFEKIGLVPQLHAVQTECIHPIAKSFDRNYQKCDTSIADGIVARVTARENHVKKIIRTSHGWGWIVSDQSILDAHSFLFNHGFQSSYEGAVTLAGLWKAQKNGFKFKKPLCLLTGAWRDQR